MDTDPLPYPYPILNYILAFTQAIKFHAPQSWTLWTIIVAIALLCLLISAFVSGSEIAYFGLRQPQFEELQQKETANAKKVISLTQHSERLLATILISNNLVNITMVILLSFAITQTTTFFNATISFILQTIVLTFLLLLFGEVLPKLTARTKMLQWALIAAPGISLLYKILSPLSSIMVKSTSLVNKLVIKKTENISPEELSHALEISEVNSKKDKEMLEGILSFGEKQVSDIMIPRVDVTAIEWHSDWDQVISTIVSSGYSRIPVYDTSRDTIRGILYSKDLLPYLENNHQNIKWQTLIRKAYYVPESRMLDDMLEDFRKKKIHIAIVVDEYGGIRGMVTLEDILEEIVGEIDDEYDTGDNPLYQKISPNVYRFQARIPLVDFFRIMDIEEEEFPHGEDAETLAGLVLAIRGDFPKEKETVESGGLRFTVLKMEKHRIISVLVKRN